MREVKNHIETNCVQAGYTPGSGEPRQIPIIQSTTFKYDTCEAMGQLFDLEAEGYFYSRLQNPTCDMVAAKICALEGGTAAMLTASGQAANFFALFNIASSTRGSGIGKSSSLLMAVHRRSPLKKGANSKNPLNMENQRFKTPAIRDFIHAAF